MSRLAKTAIVIPQGTTITTEGQTVHCKGKYATTSYEFPKGFSLSQDGGLAYCQYEGKSNVSAFHGLYRALLNNLVVGASEGFIKKLTLIGVGYRAQVKGNDIDLQLGFSHPTLLPIPTGISVEIEKSTSVSIKGSDKQQVGQFAATIRALRPPEPYKGKGVRYENEFVRKKAGKSAKK